MKLTLIILGLLLANYTFSQSIGCDSIVWTKQRKLSWSDFKAIPDFTQKADAVSNISLRNPWTSVNDTVKMTVTCSFSSCKSWSKFKNSDTLLMHEQGHFNIGEYFRRLFVKKLLEQKFGRDQFKTEIRNIRLAVTKEQDNFDKLYDSETNFSLNGNMQVTWNKKILNLIDIFNKFDKPKITIILTN